MRTKLIANERYPATRRSLRATLLAAVLLLYSAITAAPQALTVREIMAEPSIAGMRAEGEKLSPDGTKAIFLWNAQGRLPLDLYLVPADGGEAQVILRLSDMPPAAPRPVKENKLDYGLTVRDDFVKERERALGSFEWSPDSKKLVFSAGGDLYVLTLGERTPKRYTNTQTAEVAPRFIDNDRILYLQSGNLFILNTADAVTTQISREADAAKFVSVGNASVSKDGKLVAYVVSDTSKYRSLIVPGYLGEFVEASQTRRGWAEQKLFVTATDGSRTTPSEVKLPKAEGVGNFRGIKWAADNRELIVDRVDLDLKRRVIFYVSSAGSTDEQAVTVTEETDPKWQAPLSAIFEPDPSDARRLFFCSEKDGFNHIYLATIIKGQDAGGVALKDSISIEQLTRGPWQVEWAKWDPRASQIYFLSTRKGTSTRSIAAVTPDGKITDDPLTERLAATIDTPQISSEDKNNRALYGVSRWNEPTELYSRPLCFGAAACDKTETPPVRLTHTAPEKFAERWNSVPKFVNIPTRDGKEIASKVYLPAGHDAKRKYPMVIFVHGAGYLQNTINGWNNYYREFMFNEMLTQKGYVVLDIDYRGSAGYGRDWRTDVFDFLGGMDLDDHIDAIDFMVKNYGVERSRIGVYGGSYGGFMAEMLAMRAPERTAAAAALRPVADWKNYYASSPGYTVQRLGFPEKNPEAYKRSSPISYADKLERPLLILHGMSDSNVHVQDSIQLIEKLIRLGKTKYFEAMLYPSEDHGFVRPESWTDEYERILAFFEEHLKQPMLTP
ncbi:MAG: S9 family peptidase [Chloracidobacterium sp.]|nr:S9 family peptidase [Chloracidobacterium sp.]